MNIKTSTLRSIAPVAFTAMSLHALGCIGGPSESESSEEDYLDSVELGVGGDPGYPNHLRDYIVMDHGVQATVRTLGNMPLANSNGQLPSMPNMPSPSATGSWDNSRQDFLGILIGCALSDRQSVIDPAETIRTLGFPPAPEYRRYHGEVGIAPSWLSRGLTTTEKRYVTACVLARVNRYGASVNILLEAIPGYHAAIEPTQADRDMYPHPESRVWGNMFDSQVPLTLGLRVITRNPVLPFAAYVCNEFDSIFTGENGSLRQCDAIEACGFNYVGECETVAHSGDFNYAVRASVQSGSIDDICPICQTL